MKKQYVDYFGGMSSFNDTVTLYTTDTNAPLIRELSSDPNIVIQKAAYSLNKLNQLALDLVALGEGGKINGYGSPPFVNTRENRVHLSLRNNETLPNGLSAEAVMRELKADSTVLNISYQAEYPTMDDGSILVPKTGDAPHVTGLAIFLPAVAAACMALYKRAHG